MAAAQKVLVATVPFEAEVDGKPYLIRAGEYVRASHPVVKGRESLFDAPKDVDHEAKPKRRRRCSEPPKMPAKRPKAPKTAQKGYGPPHEKLRASLWDLGNADCDRREYTGPPRARPLQPGNLGPATRHREVVTNAYGAVPMSPGALRDLRAHGKN